MTSPKITVTIDPGVHGSGVAVWADGRLIPWEDR